MAARRVLALLFKWRTVTTTRYGTPSNAFLKVNEKLNNQKPVVKSQDAYIFVYPRVGRIYLTCYLGQNTYIPWWSGGTSVRWVAVYTRLDIAPGGSPRHRGPPASGPRPPDWPERTSPSVTSARNVSLKERETMSHNKDRCLLTKQNFSCRLMRRIIHLENNSTNIGERLDKNVCQ